MLSRFNYLAATGTANGVAAGSYINGPALRMGRPRAGTLSAQIDAKAETNTLTFAVAWQGSNDAAFSSPTDLSYGSANLAPVAFATGTAGADPSVKKAFAAPESAYGFKYVRVRLLVGVVTGTASDTYSIGYNFRA